MSGYITNPYKQEKTAIYLGKEVKIIDASKSDAIVIEFNNGTRKTVSKVELMSNSLFSWNQSLIESNNERIEKYTAQAKEADAEADALRKQIKSITSEIRSKCSEWGTKFKHAMNAEQRSEYSSLTDEKQDFICARTAAKNRAHGGYLAAFLCACSNNKLG